MRNSNMKIKKPIKLTPKKISSWVTTIIIVFTLVAMVFVSIFLYKNFYQSITETKEILILREKVVLDMVNMEKFNLIINRLTQKTAPQELKNITSPFK